MKHATDFVEDILEILCINRMSENLTNSKETLLDEQEEFIEWLKSKEMYNPFATAPTMKSMFDVWKAMKD